MEYRDLQELVEDICMIKTSMDELESMVADKKRQLYEGMMDMSSYDVDSKYGKALFMEFDRGTVNKDKTKEVIQTLKYDSGVPVTIDDCMKVTKCKYILVKRDNDIIIPTWEEK